MIVIRVTGRPAPQGSKVRGRHGGVYESGKNTGAWREAIRAETARVVAADPVANRYREGEPVEVTMLFVQARPRGHYGTGRNAGRLLASAPDRPAVRASGRNGGGDIDKLVRAVLDGITEGAALADDCIVTDLRVSKDYCQPGELPGVLIRVEAATVVPSVQRRLFEVTAVHYGHRSADDCERDPSGCFAPPVPAPVPDLAADLRASLEAARARRLDPDTIRELGELQNQPEVAEQILADNYLS